MRSKDAHTRRRDRQRRLRKINQLSCQRLDAWLEGGRPIVTARLTSELVSEYADLRGDRALDPPAASWEELREEGTGLERMPFFGRTSKVGRD